MTLPKIFEERCHKKSGKDWFHVKVGASAGKLDRAGLWGEFARGACQPGEFSSLFHFIPFSIHFTTFFHLLCFFISPLISISPFFIISLFHFGSYFSSFFFLSLAFICGIVSSEVFKTMPYFACCFFFIKMILFLYVTVALSIH